MLPRTKRISTELFKASGGKGRSLQGAFLSLRYTPSSDTSRYAFVVSKQVGKTAVLRNKLRRWGYEGVAKTGFNPKKPHLFFFFFKKTKEMPTFKAIYEEIHLLLTKTGTL